MDTGELLQQFVGMTGADTDFALSFLEANDWNLENAINLYLEGNFGGSSGAPPPRAAGGAQGGAPVAAGGGTIVSPPLGNVGIIDEQGSGHNIDPRTLGDEEMARAMSDIPPEMYENTEMYDEEGVRAPIMPKSEVLVEDDPFLRHIAHARMRPPRGENANVFDMFRDYRQESMLAGRGGEDQNSKKIKTLADLFRPPVDLLENGSFDNVKNIANQRKKWLLVNIQEVSEFDCQKMNRDTWADSAVKSMVRSNFVLWQVLRTTEEGMRYCRFYPVEILPHLAIIDSRTGERLDIREGFMEPKELVIWLESFIKTHSFDDSRPTVPRPESPKRLGDLTEEAQLAAAVAASLGKEIGAQIPETTTSTTSASSSAPTSTPTSASTSAPTSAPTPTVTTTTPTPVSTTTTTTTTATQPPPVEPTAPKEEPQPEPSPTLLAEHSNPSPDCSCTIQIRMPSDTIKGFFRPTDTLRTVHQYVHLHLEPKKNFVLVTTFPKKTYSGEQLDITLKQADLVPRAVLICELTD